MEQSLTAPITAVTVYRDRARISRSVQTELQAGIQTLRIEGIPNAVDADSLRVNGRGNVVILSAEVMSTYHSEPPAAKVAELIAQQRELEQQDRSLRDALSSSDTQLNWLQRLGTSGSREFAKQIASGQSSLNSLSNFSSYLAQEREKQLSQKRDYTQQREQIARELQVVQQKLDDLRQNSHHTSTSILVHVDAQSAGSVTLEMHYLVYGASWQPSYDIRLNDTQVQLTYHAQIHQHTGEDWPAAPLTLSTARPAQQRGIPSLQPWYIDIERPMPRGGLMAMPAPAPMSAPMDAPMAEVAEMPMMKHAEAAVEQNGASVHYRVAKPQAIAADGTPQRTTIAVLTLEAKLNYVAAPKLATEAYLRANITNNSEYVLLPGNCSIFHGDEFVGNTHIATIAPTESFEAQLGIDDRIKLEYKLLNRTVDKSLMGNLRRTNTSYQIIVTNLTPRAVEISILDQLPLSRHESLKVKLLEANPKPSEQDQLNVLTWNVQLAPQERRELQFAFQIEHPRDERIIGID